MLMMLGGFGLEVTVNKTIDLEEFVAITKSSYFQIMNVDSIIGTVAAL
jgi:hypothetical protein